MFTLLDSTGQAWEIGITALGAYTTTSIPGSAPAFIAIRDSQIAQIWNLVVLPTGQLNVVSTFFQAAPSQLDILDPSGTNWGLVVSNGRIDTFIPDFAPITENNARGPQLFMRYSDDSGHTWTDLDARDCGQAGEFRTRVIWWRLGRSRNRVYEISCSDPVPWRIIEGYVEASPGFQKSERVAKMVAKSN